MGVLCVCMCVWGEINLGWDSVRRRFLEEVTFDLKDNRVV